ncbi:MAG: Asd/ArgC dimerization domain-containing protein [Myxococcota bacterium]
MSTRVGVAGATGALGQEIISVLDRVQWRPETLLAYARASTSITHVDYGDERVPVDVTSEIDPEGDELDLLFTALPSEPARLAIDRAEQAGAFVVDLSGARAADAPLIVPWINPERLADDALVWQIPQASATLVASLLGPLARAGIRGPATIQLLVPASVSGRAAIEELSQQVLALFNSAPPPRKVFPTGLAFDLIPAWGNPTEEGPTVHEQRTVEQVGLLLGALEMGPIEVMAVQVPIFSGLSASVTLHPTTRVPAELASRILSDGGVVVSESAAAAQWPRPRKVEGAPFAHVARIRTTDNGALQLWATMDNLRTTAMAAAATAQALFRRRSASDG